jgi:type IV pilus assembly protein PilN
MIRINLLPVREKRKKETTKQMFFVLAGCLLGVVAVILVFQMSLAAKIKGVEKQIASYKEEIKRLQIDTRDVNKFKAEKEDLQKRLNVIYALQRAKTGPVRVLDELAMSLPKRLWLTSLREKAGKMEIKGIAFDNPTVARFMTDLERAGVIKNVELVVSQQVEKNKIKLKEFTLTCEVNYGSSPSEPSS